MKTATLVVGLATVICLGGLWLISELVARSVAEMVGRNVFSEPFFTGWVFGKRQSLLAIALVSVVLLGTLWPKLTKDRVFFVNYVAFTGLVLVTITIAVVLAAILPWLPRHGY